MNSEEVRLEVLRLVMTSPNPPMGTESIIEMYRALMLVVEPRDTIANPAGADK